MMKAARLLASGDLEDFIEEIPMPVPGSGQVLIRTAYTQMALRGDGKVVVRP
jgi:NADPH:quinone reductase-like Zn-dependent oxidoreductase